MIAGNHELSFDAATLEEARDYMRQERRDRRRDSHTHKVVTNISLVKLAIVSLLLLLNI